MISLTRKRNLTRSEQIVLEWNRKPRLMKKTGVIAFAAVATVVAYCSQGGTSLSETNTNVRAASFASATLSEIQNLPPQTSSELLPLYLGTMPGPWNESATLTPRPPFVKQTFSSLPSSDVEQTSAGICRCRDTLRRCRSSGTERQVLYESQNGVRHERCADRDCGGSRGRHRGRCVDRVRSRPPHTFASRRSIGRKSWP